MGKATGWLRSLLSGGSSKKKTGPDAKEKKGWSLVKSLRDKASKDRKAVTSDRNRGQPSRELGPVRCTVPCNACRNGVLGQGRSAVGDDDEQSKRAIAVAAATAAVAEAAVAAAQAAAAVVKLTTRGAVCGGGLGRREAWAAVKIQSTFRGYLARRALKALKGIVKIQALVRGHIVRKQAAETLRCMHALVRVQERAQAGRAFDNIPSSNGYIYVSRCHSSGHEPPEKNARRPGITKKSASRRNTNSPKVQQLPNQNWLDHWVEERYWDNRESLSRGSKRTVDENNEKILEIDAGRSHTNPKWRNIHHSVCSTMVSNHISHSFTSLPDSPSKDSTVVQQSVPSPSSVEMQPPLCSIMFPLEGGEYVESPQFYLASSYNTSSRRGPFTPLKSECCRSFLSGYSGYPNYMAYTESSKAKARSQSAPRQRSEFERYSPGDRLQGHGTGRSVAQRSLHLRFTGKDYPGSGRLDRMGMPIGM